MGPEKDPFWAIIGREPDSIMLKAITEEITPLPIIPGMNGHAGMRKLLLKNLISYLRNTVQLLYCFVSQSGTMRICYVGLK